MDTEGLLYCMIPHTKVSRADKFILAESRMVVDRGWQMGEEMRSCCSFSFV